jgi:hypothetical protein
MSLRGAEADAGRRKSLANCDRARLNPLPSSCVRFEFDTVSLPETDELLAPFVGSCDSFLIILKEIRSHCALWSDDSQLIPSLVIGRHETT